MYQNEGGIRSPRRIVITGIGAVTAIGQGVEGLWEGLVRSHSGVRRITRFDPSPFPAQIAAEVPHFDPSPWLDAKSIKRLDRCGQFSVVATKMALADSGLQIADEDPARIGVCIGSALGGAAYAEEQHTLFLEGGDRAFESTVALQMFVGAGSCNAAISLGVRGYSTSNGDSCASGTIAIGNAFRALQRGDADALFAGGSESPLAPLCYGAFARIRALSTRNDEPERACRPFDRDRDGFVMGEGAAVLLLEEREHALRRGARPYAEIVGFAITNDGSDMIAPREDAEAASHCISLALSDACLPPEAVDYINAHASSTRLNDSTETLAFKRALGAHAYRVPISGTKPMHGHALGASGAIEAAISCLALERNFLPPTLNLDHPASDCDLDYIAGEGRSQSSRVALSNSFGFGGINACLILRQP